MGEDSLIYIFGGLLLAAFLLLIAWSIHLSKNKMAGKRRLQMRIARKEHKQKIKEELPNGIGYWYNKEDMEEADDLMKYKYRHYFDTVEECVNDMVVEMYDCGIVRTEELYSIAYGDDALTPDAIVFQANSLDADEIEAADANGPDATKNASAEDADAPSTKETDASASDKGKSENSQAAEEANNNNSSSDLPPISDKKKGKIKDQWLVYVSVLLDSIAVSCSDGEAVDAIIKGLKDYGDNDLSVLLYSPE